MNLILTGFKRAGKTTYGKLLAEVLKVPFIDTDDLIREAYQKEHGAKLKAYEIHQLLGESAFRAFEERLVLKLNVAHFVISVGGGTLLTPGCREHLKALGKVVYLKQSKEDVKRALSLGRIPTFLDTDNFDESFERMYQKRKPIYEAIADHVLPINGQGSDDILQKLLQLARENSIFS